MTYFKLRCKNRIDGSTKGVARKGFPKLFRSIENTNEAMH